MTHRGLDQGFARSERLRKRSGFLSVERCGRRMAGRNYIIYCNRRGDGEATNRLGITVSRRVGPAVTRNQVKRWVRESYRRMAAVKNRGFDIVIIAKPAAAASGQLATAEEIARLLQLTTKGS